MGTCRNVALLLALAFGASHVPTAQAAIYSQDMGRISDLYVSESGTVAIVLDGGYPNANAEGQCPTNNGYAGNLTASPALKAALLSAKASGSVVQVTIIGCDSGGAWFKIVDVHIK